MEDYNYLVQRILFQVFGKDLEIASLKMENGGCVNMALSVSTNQEEYFIKWNELEFVDMFEKEAFGLEILASLNIVSIPEVIGFGQIEELSLIHI